MRMIKAHAFFDHILHNIQSVNCLGNHLRSVNIPEWPPSIIYLGGLVFNALLTTFFANTFVGMLAGP